MSSSSPGVTEKQEKEKVTKEGEDTSIKTKGATNSSKISKSSHTNSSYKSRQVCRYFVSKGSCPYGEKCRYRHPPSQAQRICQYYLSSNCRYGNQCKFLHIKRDDEINTPLSPPSLSEKPEIQPTNSHLLNVASFPSLSSSLSTRQAMPTQTTPIPIITTPTNPLAHATNYKRKGEEPLTLDDFIKRASNIKTRPAVSRPKPGHVLHSKPDEGGGAELGSLREIEIEQLRKRYHDNKLLEKSVESIIYSIVFSPTDPDWVHNKLPSFNVKVSLPSDYPRRVCTVIVTDGLPTECIELINPSLERRVEEQYAKSCGCGQYELILRPVLNWLDNNVMTLIKGTSFVEEYKTKYNDEESQEGKESEEEVEIETPLKAFQSPVKRGTEIRLVGMEFSDSIGTVHVNSVKLTVECGRCKSHCDIMCKGNKTSSQVCIRCNQIIALTFNPDLLHRANPTLAYLDLSNCRPVDVILSSCEGHLSCVECGREQPLKGWSFGQELTSSCHYCHSSLSISASQCRYVMHQPGQVVFANPIPEVITKKKRRPDFIEGQPLPDTGTCTHYKKSHRWLRFPCCGKVFPCDVCHDSVEDHPMERANRMICGYCAKEQVYNGTKPCSGCGSDMTQSRSSSHWEGGQGCRNKVKMSRNDRQKYSNSEVKTVSMKTERVGMKGKNNNQKV